MHPKLDREVSSGTVRHGACAPHCIPSYTISRIKESVCNSIPGYPERRNECLFGNIRQECQIVNGDFPTWEISLYMDNNDGVKRSYVYTHKLLLLNKYRRNVSTKVVRVKYIQI